jgi:hypothetical protein
MVVEMRPLHDLVLELRVQQDVVDLLIHLKMHAYHLNFQIRIMNEDLVFVLNFQYI